MSLHQILEVIGASTILIVSLVYFGAIYYDITKMILTEISKHSIFLREVKYFYIAKKNLSKQLTSLT